MARREPKSSHRNLKLTRYPLLVDSSAGVIASHGRLLAALKLGVKARGGFSGAPVTFRPLAPSLPDMRRPLLVSLIFMGLIVLAAWAADISGQWVAEIPGRQGQAQTTTFTFKADGDRLTGTIATPRGETPISDGKIQGDDVSFTQTLEFGGNQMKFLYKGKVAGSEIKFTRQREGGEGQAREFTAKRRPS